MHNLKKGKNLTDGRRPKWKKLIKGKYYYVISLGGKSTSPQHKQQH
jgi:hypothetical protein